MSTFTFFTLSPESYMDLKNRQHIILENLRKSQFIHLKYMNIPLYT
ncbi:hypothetical protein BACI71_100266 [Bacillus mycoides]|uniref:Uncharacterized protein n=1 Tax=Bacillus mycoides TaxID=1405 RepID=A0A653NB16_BACMY|nr:hypothetical protein BACI71_100266 [Bacillus mycoides]